MSKINILSSDIYNKISAGEVVERPASIVKELVENSIDAGAENIEITVKNGGIDLINVVDDGCGIEKDDIDVAFLPHTTSKIALAEDLNEIKTLGFRGEALASIAAVSVVEMLTKTEGDETGSKVEVQAGRIKSKGEFSANTGHKRLGERLVLQRSRTQKIFEIGRAGKRGNNICCREAYSCQSRIEV